MGGICSNMGEDVYNQEKYVHKKTNYYYKELRGKYYRDQIEGKLRQMYNNTDHKKNTFISNDNWNKVKNKKY